MDLVLSSPVSGYDFVIVELSLSEAFSAVRDEVRSILLFVRGIPISRWATKRETKEVSFSEGLARRVYELTSLGLDALRLGDKLGIIPATSASDEDAYFEVYSSLVFLHPELKTQDAILLATGIFQQATCFVTGDRDLVRMNKGLKERYALQVIRPDRALQLLSRPDV
jgi:hypothetical protein